MEDIRISLNIRFYIDKLNKLKIVEYRSFTYEPKHKGYRFCNKYENLKLGVQLCDFLNTDFHSYTNAKEFINKYSIVTIAKLANLPIYTYYKEDEYENMLQEVINNTAKQLDTYKNDFIEDIKYIFNLNDLEELSNLSPAQRLFVLRNSKKTSAVLKDYDPENLKLELNSYGNFVKFSITEEEEAQEMAKYVDKDELFSYRFICTDIMQSFIIELLEITSMENFEIKQCKNCGKYFVPDNRSDEIYCSNIYENNKTCKEVGHFRTQQKLMALNDDLRIYRNVYQKLLLRTRRNPLNEQYEKEFKQFKEKNIELKEKVNAGKISQAEYMEWLNKQ